MSEYSYEINGYTVGIDKSEKQDETALCIMRQIEDKVIVEGTLHGRLASFVDSILQKNTILKNDFVSKTQLIKYLKEDIEENILSEECNEDGRKELWTLLQQFSSQANNIIWEGRVIWTKMNMTK